MPPMTFSLASPLMHTMSSSTKVSRGLVAEDCVVTHGLP